MKIVCPHCGVKGTLADSFIHKKIRCPRCKQIFNAEVEAEVAFTPVETTIPSPKPPPSRPRMVMPQPMRPQAAPPNTPEDGLPVAAPQAVPPPPRFIGRPERIVVPPNAKLNAQPLNKIPEAARPVAVDLLDSEGAEPVPPQAASSAAPQVVSPVVPQVVPPVVPPAPPQAELTEQARIDLDAHFVRKLLCAGCGCQADNDDEFLPGRAGLLCPACHAAEESTDNSSPPDAAKPAIDQGTAQATSNWQRQDELPQMAENDKWWSMGVGTPFTVFSILREAWKKLKGAKREVWGAVTIIVLINLIFGVVTHFLPDMKTNEGLLDLTVVSVVALVVNSLLLSGLGYLGLCQARGEEGGWATIFVPFIPGNLINLLLLFIFLPIIVGLGLACLIVPGIYLAITLSLSPLLVLDKGMRPWKAMLESWRGSHTNCLNIFLLYFALKVVFWAAAIFLLLGLFWMLPFVFVVYGVLYRRLFDGNASVAHEKSAQLFDKS